jgi:hypothetical protein
MKAVRDASLATAMLLAAVWAGSGGFAFLDRGLVGYLAATLVATFGVAYRLSACWRRPPAAFYARALAHALRAPRRLRAALAAAGRDLAAQRFVARRSRLRWAAHLLLSLGTLASFAITLPLVFGWVRFEADGEDVYRIFVWGLPAGRFLLDGALAWLVFHALALAAGGVVVGAVYFLGVRLRARRLPGVMATFHAGPLVLLLAVAVTGLALPATRGRPALFALAARAHEAAVVVLLLAIPCSKLGHVLVRPLHVGAQLVRQQDEPRAACTTCGTALAPTAQQAAVERLLTQRGFRFEGHQRRCPACRRRALAVAQTVLLGARFHPPIGGARPAPASAPERAA